MSNFTATVSPEFLKLLGLHSVLGQAMPVAPEVVLTTKPFNFDRKPISIVTTASEPLSAALLSRFLLESEREFLPDDIGEKVTRRNRDFVHLLSWFAIVWQDCGNVVTSLVCEPPVERWTVGTALNEYYPENGWLPSTMIAIMEWQACVFYSKVRDHMAESYSESEQKRIIPAFRNKKSYGYRPAFGELEQCRQLAGSFNSPELHDWAYNREIVWLNPERVDVDWTKVRRCVEELLRKQTNLSQLAYIATMLKTNIASSLITAP